MVGTHTVKSNITPEMVSDIRNTNFYVKKDLVRPMDNKILRIRECPHKNHYEVHINYVLFDRLIKIIKITDTKLYEDIIKTVEICVMNSKNWWSVAEDEMVEELTQSIDRQILKDLMEGKQWQKR
jgi:hypothetical protein